MRKYFFLMCALISINYAFFCSEFLLESVNKDFVIGRSMEFGQNLKCAFNFHPKNKENVSIVKNKKAFSWTSKYSFVSIDAFESGPIVDGLNEKGLSLGVLWFVGAEYPKITTKDLSKIIALEDLGPWILGSFANVEEVKDSIRNVQIWAHVIKQLKEIPPFHLSLYDKSGKGIVVEFIDGKIEISENTVGVFTNTPKFEWQVTNLRNYINLTAVNKEVAKLDEKIIYQTGQGSGLLGIPGDWTPPSRFVKIAILKNFVKKTKNIKENVNLAFHLLNTVDIPYGVVRNKEGTKLDYTQWIIVKDLKNLKIYYRTYQDLNIKSFNLLDKIKNQNLKKIPL